MASEKSKPSLKERLARCAEWPSQFSPEEWTLYRSVIAAASANNIPFAIGGALAALTYIGGWRNTKDLDIYAQGRDRDRLIQILSQLGLQDYYEVQSYDRRWIYRAHRGDIIVDVIWAMANQRSQVDQRWLEGPEIEVDGERFRLLAPEEVIWSKLYVLQHDRSDWPDCLNVLYGVGDQLDWSKLISNVGSDLPLLSALVAVFSWIAPKRAHEFPPAVWDQLRLRAPAEQIDHATTARRASLLDTRTWFYPSRGENARNDEC
jgi:hypothetical protein